MSMLIDPGQKPSTQGPPVPATGGTAPVTPHYFVAPKRPWSERINMRIVAFAVVVAIIIGAPFYRWLAMALNGGIVDHGTYYAVDLKAMSNFDLDQINGESTDIPQKWRDLDGKHVELIGQMWAQHEAGDGQLSYFQLCFSRTKCCFQGPPLVQHFVDCNVKPGVSAYYYDDMVRVTGVFHVKLLKDVDKGVMKIKSIYSLDVDGAEGL